MTTWTTEDRRLLEAAIKVLTLLGYELAWEVGPQGITTFRTRRVGSKNVTSYNVVKRPHHEHQGERMLAMALYRALVEG